jgi:hypothetical protein
MTELICVPQHMLIQRKFKHKTLWNLLFDWHYAVFTSTSYEPTSFSSSSIGTTTLSFVSACSTAVEHSQQKGFTECRCQRHVKPSQLGGGLGI